MTKSAQYEGAYLAAEDVTKPITVTIAKVVPENQEKDAQGRPIDRMVLHFEKATKRWIINVSTYRVLKTMFGKDTANWVGKTITLQRRYLKHAFGEFNVPVVRCIPPADVPVSYSIRKHLGSDVPYSV